MTNTREIAGFGKALMPRMAGLLVWRRQFTQRAKACGGWRVGLRWASGSARAMSKVRADVLYPQDAIAGDVQEAAQALPEQSQVVHHGAQARNPAGYGRTSSNGARRRDWLR